MWRVPRGDQKENPSLMGGCNCKKQKVKRPNDFNGLELLPSKVLVDKLRPSLKDITSEKNRILCQCGARSKSTSSENIVITDGPVPNRQRHRSASTIDGSNFPGNFIFQQNIIIEGKVKETTVKTYTHGLKHVSNETTKENFVKISKSVSTSTTGLLYHNGTTKSLKSPGVPSSDEINIEKTSKSTVTNTTSRKYFENAVSSTGSRSKERKIKYVQQTHFKPGVKGSLRCDIGVQNATKSDSTYSSQGTKAEETTEAKSVKLEILNGNACAATLKYDIRATQSEYRGTKIRRLSDIGNIQNKSAGNTYSDKKCIDKRSGNSHQFAISDSNQENICKEEMAQSYATSSKYDMENIYRNEREYSKHTSLELGLKIPQLQIELSTKLEQSERTRQVHHAKTKPCPLAMSSDLDFNVTNIGIEDLSQISTFHQGDDQQSMKPLWPRSGSNLRRYTPILPNQYTGENIFISKRTDRLREPKIKRRSSINEHRNKAKLPYVGDIYNEEYLNDIYVYICKMEKYVVLQEDFLQTYNPNRKCRSGIANWLLKVQPQLQFSEGEYYLAIILLDTILAKIKVPINMYQLLMMSTIWIATKIIGTNNIKASTLVHFSEGAYLIQQLVKMERKVLKIMDFYIPTIEPSLCLQYYLKLLNIQNIDLPKLSTFYILDCFSLLPEFSSIRSSILAGATINLTLNIFDGKGRNHIHSALNNIFSRNDLMTIMSIEPLLYYQLINMSDESYMFNEPFKSMADKKTLRK